MSKQWLICLIAIGAALASHVAMMRATYNIGWDRGYWRGYRIAQWNCYHNRKTCQWAKDTPPAHPETPNGP